MQTDRPLSEVVSLVEDVLSVVVSQTSQTEVDEQPFPTTSADEECGDSSGTSVCGYDADCDIEDSETVIDDTPSPPAQDVDDDGYHSTSRLINCDDNDSTEDNKFETNSSVNCVKKWVNVGNNVLARWTDGLFYLGLIVQIDTILEKCLIRFEDSSLYWIRVDDLHKQLSVGSVMADSDILCAICRDGRSISPNEIVICDVCNQGYHQRCHKPRIGDEILEPDVPWTCRLCVFALGTKEGGAEKNGIIGQALKHMKTEFPYDSNDLHWDDEHQTNREQKYCYCGGNGNYYSKMLQCSSCRQWFHEACIQALETPLLYGDHYYTFKCSVCTKGKEQLKRIIMKWSDMIALVINNLALQHQKRFFDLSTDIVPFIQNNCNMLRMSEDIQKLTERELQDRITAVLKTNESRFINGKEMRKKAGCWALRMAFPFEKPLIFAPPLALQSSSPTSPTSSPPVPTPTANAPEAQKYKAMAHLMFGACRKGASKHPLLNTMQNNKRVQKNSRSNSFSSSTGSNSCIASTVSAMSRSSQSTSKTAIKNKVKPKLIVKASVKRPKNSNNTLTKKYPKNSEDSSDTEMISMPQIESLDAVIPVPKDFEGDNNPFCDTKPNVLTSRHANGSSADPTQTYRISCKPETKPADGSGPKMECFADSANPPNERKFNILAQRVKPDGKVEYLLEWQD